MLKEWVGRETMVATNLRGEGGGWGMESRNYKCSITGLPIAVTQRNQNHLQDQTILLFDN